MMIAGNGRRELAGRGWLVCWRLENSEGSLVEVSSVGETQAIL